VLDQYVHEIQISCLPADLPVSITVNVSALALNESLHLKEIILPANVKAAGDMDQVIFHVGLPKVKVEVEKTAEVSEGAAAASADGEKAEGAAAAKTTDTAKATDAKAAPAKEKKE